MKTRGRSGIVAECVLWPWRKMGGAIAQNGTFYYLYSVLPIGRVIAMVHVSHRGDVIESLRWRVGVIAMKQWFGTAGFTKRDRRFLEKKPIIRNLWQRNETQGWRQATELSSVVAHDVACAMVQRQASCGAYAWRWPTRSVWRWRIWLRTSTMPWASPTRMW